MRPSNLKGPFKLAILCLAQVSFICSVTGQTSQSNTASLTATMTATSSMTATMTLTSTMTSTTSSTASPSAGAGQTSSISSTATRTSAATALPTNSALPPVNNNTLSTVRLVAFSMTVARAQPSELRVPAVRTALIDGIAGHLSVEVERVQITSIAASSRRQLRKLHAGAPSVSASKVWGHEEPMLLMGRLLLGLPGTGSTVGVRVIVLASAPVVNETEGDPAVAAIFNAVASLPTASDALAPAIAALVAVTGALASVFTLSVAPAALTNIAGSVLPTPRPSPSAAPISSGMSLSTLLGAAVGGSAALVAIVVIVAVVACRRRRLQHAQALVTPTSQTITIVQVGAGEHPSMQMQGQALAGYSQQGGGAQYYQVQQQQDPTYYTTRGLQGI